MTSRTLIIFVCLFPIVLFFLGNSGGRALVVGQGNTGAPGDQTIGGQALTCASSSCHGSGSASGIQTGILIELYDSGGQKIDADGYLPGQTYEVRITVEVLSGNPAGYGFQAVCLNGPKGQNAGTAGTWSDPGANVQIATANATGRTYAEHKGVSASPVFSVNWTAPTENSETITFYVCGNGVNGNGNSGGDGGACSTLEVAKNTTTSSQQQTISKEPSIHLFPNPVISTANLQLKIREGGFYQLMLNSSDGRQVWQQTYNLESGSHMVQLPMEGYRSGMWYWTLKQLSTGKTTVIKMVKTE